MCQTPVRKQLACTEGHAVPPPEAYTVSYLLQLYLHEQITTINLNLVANNAL
jgi:hypothetical protein